MRRLGSAVLLAALSTAALEAQTAPPTSAPPPGDATSTAAAAPSANDPNNKLVNIPGTPWQVYGSAQTSKYDDKGGPQGYPVTQVSVSATGKNVWDVGANAPLAKPIAGGDVVFVAVFLRAPKLAEGQTVTLPVAVTGATPPYDLVATGSAQVGNQWKQVYAVGKAPHDFAAGATQAAVHLAGAKQVVDLGPARVFDFGPNADTTRLPHN